MEDEIDQELFDDPAVAALEETEDLDGSDDVDGGDELARLLLLGGHDGGGGERTGRRGRCLARLEVDVSAVPDGLGRSFCCCRSAMADSLHHDHGAGEDGEDPNGQPDGETGAAARARARRARCGGELRWPASGAPTQGGFFWAGRELGTAGKLSVTVADAVRLTMVEFPVPVKPVYSSPTCCPVLTVSVPPVVVAGTVKK